MIIIEIVPKPFLKKLSMSNVNQRKLLQIACS